MSTSTPASSSTNSSSGQTQPNTSAVANSFVFKYYSILNKDPNSLFHFYKDNSVLTRGEDPNAPEDTSYGKENIKQKIQSLTFQDCQVALTVVDSQTSLENSVLINVVGTLSNKKEQPKKFIQTFVLAVQTDPVGFYVRNDIFRYLRDDLPGDVSLNQPQVAHPQQPKVEQPQPTATTTSHQQHAPSNTTTTTVTSTTTAPVVEEPKVTPPTTPNTTTSSSPAQPVHQQPKEDEHQKKPEKTEVVEAKKEHAPSTTATTTPVATNDQTAAPEKKHERHEKKANKEKEHVAEKKQEVAANEQPQKEQQPQQQQLPVRQPKVKQERPEKPKQPKVATWATIAASPQGQQTGTPALPPQQLLEKQKEVLRAEEEKIKEAIDALPIDRSVYVTNLPYTVTEEQVRTVFSHHGEVKSVVLRRGNAFVEFATPEQGKALIEKNSAQRIVIDNRELGVEPKKRTKFPARGEGKPKERDFANKQEKDGSQKREKKPSNSASSGNNNHHGGANHTNNNYRHEAGNAKDNFSGKKSQGNKQTGGEKTSNQSRAKANNQ